MRISKESDRFIEYEFRNRFVSTLVCCFALIAFGAVSLIIVAKTAMLSQGKIIMAAVSVIEIALGIFVLVFGIISFRKNKQMFADYIEKFSFGVENITKAAVKGYPDPIVVISRRGEIQWYNLSFSELCGRGGMFGESIFDVFSDIPLKELLSNEKAVKSFSFKGKDFVIRCDSVEGNEFIAVSFSDVSELTRLRMLLDEKRTVVVSVLVDNYDEVLKETPNSNHGVLIGDIEHCIASWTEKGNGFYRKCERDKFILLFEAVMFEKLMNEKFSVLNDVKELEQQNKIPVTLSIGVGMIGEDLNENEKLAISALELALGRGGDQAVVKTDDGYAFFGAKSLGVEKTTKVKARVVAQKLCELTDNASNVVIMGHRNSDYDSFGAAIGLYRAIVNRNKKAYIAMDRGHNNVREILSDFLIIPEYRDAIVSNERLAALVDENTLLIIVDTHRAQMTENPGLLNDVKNVVLIDHHRRSEDFIEDTVLSYNETYASSACEMVTEMFRYIDDGKGMTVAEAEALYCGIYMDTKGFMFKTGARTFQAAAFLRKKGVDPVRVHNLFRTDIAMYIQKSRVISKAKIYRDNIAIAVCDEAAGNIQLVAAQAADDLLNISGVEASFVLADLQGKTVISGRSLGNINVQVILERLGGGGHITIAGAQLENNSLNIAELKLKNAIDDALFE